jgi:hypothetical protein
MNKYNPYEMPETTEVEIIEKIREMSYEIRLDWSDPRSECREIERLTTLLLAKINTKEK